MRDFMKLYHANNFSTLLDWFELHCCATRTHFMQMHDTFIHFTYRRYYDPILTIIHIAINVQEIDM